MSTIGFAVGDTVEIVRSSGWIGLRFLVDDLRRRNDGTLIAASGHRVANDRANLREYPIDIDDRVSISAYKLQRVRSRGFADWYRRHS